MLHEPLRACSNVMQKFVGDMMAMIDVRRVDYVVLNTGILRYPNVSTR